MGRPTEKQLDDAFELADDAEVRALREIVARVEALLADDSKHEMIGFRRAISVALLRRELPGEPR